MSQILPKFRLFGITLPLASIPVIGLPFSKGLLSFKKKRPAFCLENGFHLKLECGRDMLIEKNGTMEYEVSTPTIRDIILLENGCGIILEQGGFLKQEKNY